MLDSKFSTRSAAAAASIFVASTIGGPAAALSIDQTGDIAAGMAAFGASMPLFTWSNLYSAGTTWTAGNFGPSTAFGTQTATDPLTGTVVNSPPNGLHNGINNLYVANWIDGPGFNLPGGSAGPDLALDGQENFKLSFVSGVTKIGFAVSTGLGIFAPSQVNHLGAVFQLSTNNGETGTLTLLDAGNGLAVWVTLQSSTPFTSLTFIEPSGDGADQYFGNFVSGPAPVPLPPSLLLQLTGIALLGFLGWRRRSARLR